MFFSFLFCFCIRLGFVALHFVLFFVVVFVWHNKNKMSGERERDYKIELATPGHTEYNLLQIKINNRTAININISCARAFLRCTHNRKQQNCCGCFSIAFSWLANSRRRIFICFGLVRACTDALLFGVVVIVVIAVVCACSAA